MSQGEPTLHFRMKAVAEGMSFFIKSNLPAGLTGVLLDMAAEIDRLKAEIANSKEK